MVSGSDLTITSAPLYPAANQMITLKAEIYVTDINRAEISWFVDGKLKERGVGKKEFSFRTKDLGKTSLIDIQINTSDLGRINKRIKITPTEINFIWEANTYSPPFYKGKALNTHEAAMKMVALPIFVDSAGRKIDAKNLVYTWEKDWKIAGAKSGYGKNSFSFIGPQIFRETVISVTVETLDGALKNKKNLSLPSHSPEIIFYEKNPLLGILDNNALGNSYKQTGEELALVARPFFFSKENLPRQTKYNWTLNGKKLEKRGLEIVVRRTGNTGGRSLIALEIQNLKKIMQFAKNSFRIDLTDNSPSETNFGF